MFPFELLILGFLVLIVFKELSGFAQEDPVFRLLPAGIVLFFILHLFFEGLRWQMFPLYAGSLLSLLNLPQREEYLSVPRLFCNLFIGFFVVVTVAVILFFPVRLGQKEEFSSGYQSLVILDVDRKDSSGNFLNYELDVFYPVAAISDKSEWAFLKSLTDTEHIESFMSDYTGIPGFFWSHLSLYRMPVSLQAESERGKFPSVLLTGLDSYPDFTPWVIGTALAEKGIICLNVKGVKDDQDMSFLKAYMQEASDGKVLPFLKDRWDQKSYILGYPEENWQELAGSRVFFPWMPGLLAVPQDTAVEIARFVSGGPAPDNLSLFP